MPLACSDARSAKDREVPRAASQGGSATHQPMGPRAAETRQGPCLEAAMEVHRRVFSHAVTGRFKTSHRWALQNQPGFMGFSSRIRL